MQAIVTWECGGVSATCVACAIIPRGGGARAHATRVRSHAGTGDGVAARSECRHAIGRGKSRARRAFLNRRFWVHAARGGRTASSGARRSRRFFGIRLSVFLVWKKCIYFPIHTGSLPFRPDANFHPRSRSARPVSTKVERARVCLGRFLPLATPPLASSPRVASADSRSASARRAAPGAARGAPRDRSARRVPARRGTRARRVRLFVEKGRLAGGGKCASTIK